MRFLDYNLDDVYKEAIIPKPKEALISLTHDIPSHLITPDSEALQFNVHLNGRAYELVWHPTRHAGLYSTEEIKNFGEENWHVPTAQEYYACMKIAHEEREKEVAQLFLGTLIRYREPLLTSTSLSQVDGKFRILYQDQLPIGQFTDDNPSYLANCILGNEENNEDTFPKVFGNPLYLDISVPKDLRGGDRIGVILNLSGSMPSLEVKKEVRYAKGVFWPVYRRFS